MVKRYFLMEGGGNKSWQRPQAHLLVVQAPYEHLGGGHGGINPPYSGPHKPLPKFVQKKFAEIIPLTGKNR